MTMTIDEIDAEIAMWERRRDKWLLRHERAMREYWACQDEIQKIRRQRIVLTEQTERK